MDHPTYTEVILWNLSQPASQNANFPRILHGQICKVNEVPSLKLTASLQLKMDGPKISWNVTKGFFMSAPMDPWWCLQRCFLDVSPTKTWGKR